MLRFVRELARHGNALAGVVATEADYRRTLFGPHPLAECIIGELDGEAVAFAVFFPKYSTHEGRSGLHLDDLFVRPEFRNRGFGRKMFRYLAAVAVERGCPRFEWWVRNHNLQAFGFYRSLGAEARSDLTLHRLTGEALRELAEAHATGR